MQNVLLPALTISLRVALHTTRAAHGAEGESAYPGKDPLDQAHSCPFLPESVPEITTVIPPVQCAHRWIDYCANVAARRRKLENLSLACSIGKNLLVVACDTQMSVSFD